MNTEKQWNDVWKSKSLLSRLVDFGRKTYNFKFISILKDDIKVDSFCELGCGSSSLLAQISQSAKKVVGIDYSDQALAISQKLFDKKNIKNVEFVMDNCLDLKIEEKFDTVWSQGLIEHFDDPAKIIKEHLKITKQGGTTAISVPCKYSYMHLWYVLTRPKLLRSLWPWTEQIFFSKKSLRKSLKKYCSNEYQNYKIKLYPLWGVVVLKTKKR
jgi:ubiquinone/menaquinone biosynthesis C-methylase UbiE